MGKWLSKFLGNHQESLPDSPDILPSVSGLSGPGSRDGAEIEATDTPMPPLKPGWLVVYRDRRGHLCGGSDDREHGTVQVCRWENTAWTIVLTDGQQFPLTAIRSVGQTDSSGLLVAGWTVREHGYDGQGPLA